MSCLRADQLALFVEGGLSEPELREIDEHLIACAECAQTVVTLAAERSAHDTPTTEDDIAPPWVRPGTRFGRYVIVKFLGAGGMGAVYSAYDPALDRKVALKLIRQQLLSSGVEEARSRLLREAQVAARLSHVNVVSVHDVGVVGEQAFVAMELVEGESLTRWLEKDRSWREICEVFLEAGRGLAAAHAAGVVHRDFKPDNVLVGAGGRIRVADFGLAASPASLHGERPTGGGTIDKGRFTLDGALLGTPLYMAPEQMEGKAADAKADQFGFCVALYEAWYRQGPFEGSTFETLLREKAAGHIRAEPKKTRVPPRLQRALRRGLAPQPEERYPSMEALLSELAREPSLHAGRALSIFAAALAVVAMAAGSVWMSGRQTRLCRKAGEQVKEVWNPARQERVREAFAKTQKPFALDDWRSAASTLDRYAEAWGAMRSQVCEATRVDGHQSEHVMDLRMRCLDRRLQELAALVDVFSSPNEQAAEGAVDAAHALSPIASCADVEALGAQVRPPEKVAIREQAEELRRQVTRAKVQLDVGDCAAARPVLEAVVPTTRSLGYRPVEAEALFQLGRLQLLTADLASSLQSLEASALCAEAGGVGETEVMAYLLMTDVVGWEQRRPADAKRWVEHAAFALERLGQNEYLGGRVLDRRARLAYAEGKLDDAFRIETQALAILSRTAAPDDPAVISSLSMIGAIQADRGSIEEAIAAQEESLAKRLRAHGAEHPDVATGLCNLSWVYQEAGRVEEALETNLRCLEIRLKSLGPEHPRTASAIAGLGAILSEQPSRLDEALTDLQRALPALRRAAPYGAATALARMSLVLVELRRPREALDVAQESIQMMQQHLGATNALLAVPMTTAGMACSAMGRKAEALRWLGEANQLVAEAEQNPLSLFEMGTMRLELATALWANGERAPARESAQRARENLLAAGPRARRRLTAVEEWIASHPTDAR